ncbi:MAG: prolyl oligopeptidase family serine peptidase [Lewinellaceae bacterium]|nr:prolyl oligopeptidase family serine peptidase [Lewinellaceae bacterium]
MRNYHILFLTALTLFGCTHERQIQTPGPETTGTGSAIPEFLQAKTFQADSLALPYRWISPLETQNMPAAMKNFEKSADGKYPLVVFLHGSGERGDDNQAQLRNGAKAFWAPEFYVRHPHFFLAPQCPKDVRWSNRDFEKEVFFFEEPSVPMQALIQLLENVFQENPAIDRDRIYITGLSMGGMGTFDLLVRQPGWFAAAVPVCGGADASIAPEIKHIAIWAFHGSADDVVPVKYTRRIVMALRQAGAPMIGYCEYPGWNHNTWDDTYANPLVLEWLFRQKKRAP